MSFSARRLIIIGQTNNRKLSMLSTGIFRFYFILYTNTIIQNSIGKPVSLSCLLFLVISNCNNVIIFHTVEIREADSKKAGLINKSAQNLIVMGFI